MHERMSHLNARQSSVEAWFLVGDWAPLLWQRAVGDGGALQLTRPPGVGWGEEEKVAFYYSASRRTCTTHKQSRQ